MKWNIIVLVKADVYIKESPIKEVHPSRAFLHSFCQHLGAYLLNSSELYNIYEQGEAGLPETVMSEIIYKNMTEDIKYRREGKRIEKGKE